MEQATKPCPFCGEEILAVAKKCKYCKSYLDPTLAPRPPASSSLERMVIPVDVPTSAIAAGYLGLLAFVPLVGALFGVLAVVCGRRALKTIHANPALHGKGRAWFGIIIGAPLAILWGFFLVALILGLASEHSY
jgi:hypothetical protein